MRSPQENRCPLTSGDAQARQSAAPPLSCRTIACDGTRSGSAVERRFGAPFTTADQLRRSPSEEPTVHSASPRARRESHWCSACAECAGDVGLAAVTILHRQTSAHRGGDWRRSRSTGVSAPPAHEDARGDEWLGGPSMLGKARIRTSLPSTATRTCIGSAETFRPERRSDRRGRALRQETQRLRCFNFAR
jgi:hypothetical protein